MSKPETPAEIAYARRLADNLRRYSQELDALSWNLDSALSSLDKDDAGYRTANAANRTGGANGFPGEIREAVLAAEKRFPWLKPTEGLDKAS